MTVIKKCNVAMTAGPDGRVEVVSEFAKAVIANAEALRVNAEALALFARSIRDMPAPQTVGIMVKADPAPTGPRLEIERCALRAEPHKDA